MEQPKQPKEKVVKGRHGEKKTCERIGGKPGKTEEKNFKTHQVCWRGGREPE